MKELSKFNYNKLNQNYKIGELYFFLSQHRNFLVDKLEIWDTNLRSTFVWWIGLRMKGYYVRKLCIFFQIRMRKLSSWHVWSLTARAAGWYREPELMVMVWTWSIQLPNPAPSSACLLSYAAWHNVSSALCDRHGTARLIPALLSRNLSPQDNVTGEQFDGTKFSITTPNQSVAIERPRYSEI